MPLIACIMGPGLQLGRSMGINKRGTYTGPRMEREISTSGIVIPSLTDASITALSTGTELGVCRCLCPRAAKPRWRRPHAAGETAVHLQVEQLAGAALR